MIISWLVGGETMPIALFPYFIYATGAGMCAMG
jgi:hypothetical protein